MSLCLKFFKLFLVFIIGVFLLLGCKPTKDEIKIDTVSESQNGDKTEYYETYVERRLIIDIDVPFEIGTFFIKGGTYTKLADIHIIKENKKLYYTPEKRHIGEEEISIDFLDIKNTKNKITIIYKVNTVKPPLAKNRDYVISYYCDAGTDITTQSFDIDIIDKDLTFLEKVYDNKKVAYTTIVPEKSNNYLIRWNDNASLYYPEAVRHHDIFSRHTDDNMMITCNYKDGYFRLIYPLKGKEWYAIKHYGNEEITYGRNDLYFHVSFLSELHSKIYFKEYSNGMSSENSYMKANKFMDKIFQNSHYTAELLHNYDDKTGYWIKTYPSQYNNISDMYNYENKLYQDRLKFLADEITDGSISKLLQKIADNYESYYILSDHKCLDSTICGVLFPEYTKSVNSNPNFENGLSSWIQRDELVYPASGRIEYVPNEHLVNLEYSANRLESNDASSSLDLYQIQNLNGSSVDSYFLRFDLNEVYGGASGNPVISGTLSSGFTGGYTCYKDSQNKYLGCLTWSDHTNKFDLAWGPIQNRIESSDTFYNVRLEDVLRRVRPNVNRFVFTIHLGAYLKKHLPAVYKHRNEIKSIEYGLFTTEFRNKANNSCYFCEAKIKANEINLLKIR